jgi:uncharacterized RDD family membrane protein YckC
MNRSIHPLIRTLLVASLFVLCAAVPLHAQEPEVPAEAPAGAEAPAETPPATDEAPADTTDADAVEWADDFRPRYVDSVVSVGSDSKLGADERAEVVVSVFGSSTSEGRVDEAVVSVFGDTRTTGRVGEAVVAVLGDVYVNNYVGDAVVAVLGNVELGPEADVSEVVVIGGTLTRADTAKVRGGVQRILTSEIHALRWLRPWTRHALLYLRPLALEPGLGWAWGFAFAFLALYVGLALLFRDGVDRCVQTLETRPGPSFLAAILATLLTPILIIVLIGTVLGIPAVPFVLLGLFGACLFGKAVVLGWIGRRVTRFFEDGPLAHTAFAVLIGGLVVMALYLVPFLGFVLFNAIGVLGLGVVIYTLLLSLQDARRARVAAEPPPPPPAGPPPAAAAGFAGATSASAAFSAGPTAETNAEAAPPSDSATAPPGPAAAPAAEPKPATAAHSLSDAAVAALPRASFWMRMGALAIDAVMIAIIVNMLNDSGSSLWLLLLGAYGAVMWKLRGTTIGGIVFGLKVVRVDGRPIDWPTAIVRALSCFLSFVIVGLGFLWIIFDDDRQAWHDKIAGTVVVTVPKGVSLL